MRPDYVIIGHVSLDQAGQSSGLGGTVTFGARVARVLGHTVGVVTSAPESPESYPEFEGIEVVSIPSSEWTSFKNEYGPNGRTQTWLSTAESIDSDDVPPAWHTARIVHFAPIAQELSPNFALGCPAGLCCATIQGWLRGRSSASSVLVEVNADLMRGLRYLDAAVVSEEDVQGDQTLIGELAENARVLVVTRSALGCDVFVNGERSHIPTRQLDIADPTGAGDIFATAFFTAFFDTQDANEAAAFANSFTGRVLSDLGSFGTQTGESEFEYPYVRADRLA